MRNIECADFGQPDLQCHRCHLGHALKRVRERSYDLVLLKNEGSDTLALDFVRVMRTLFPQLPLLFLSMNPDNRNVVDVLRAGANGYVQRESMATELADAVNSLLKGFKYVS